MKTCLYRLLGECKNCKENYDIRYYPNNYDCKKYKEINLLTFEIKTKLSENK